MCKQESAAPASPDDAANAASESTAQRTLSTGQKALTLSVQSTPLDDAPIGGKNGAATNYQLECIEGDQIQLIAPPGYMYSGGIECTFARWMLNGEPQPDGQAHVEFALAD